MAGKQGKYDSPPPVESPLDDRFTKAWSHSSYRPVVRVFSDQICHPGHDAERGYVFTGLLFFFLKNKKTKKKPCCLSRVLRFLSLALALGKHGITVNAYAPGGVETRLRQSSLSLHP